MLDNAFIIRICGVLPIRLKFVPRNTVNIVYDFY